jgi:hypothetical protein
VDWITVSPDHGKTLEKKVNYGKFSGLEPTCDNARLTGNNPSIIINKNRQPREEKQKQL